MSRKARSSQKRRRRYEDHWFVKSLKYKCRPIPKIKQPHSLPGQMDLFDHQQETNEDDAK